MLGASEVSRRAVGVITIKMQEGADMKEGESQIKNLLRQRRRIQAGQIDDFAIRNLSEVFAAQLLIEATTLSLVGGAAGVVFGIAASAVIGSWAGWRTALQPEALVLSVGFAAAVGIFFGYYPAWKASRLTPIEALRYE